AAQHNLVVNTIEALARNGKHAQARAADILELRKVDTKRRLPDSIRARNFSSKAFAPVVSSFSHRHRVTMSPAFFLVISTGQNLLCCHLSSREDFSSLGLIFYLEQMKKCVD